MVSSRFVGALCYMVFRTCVLCSDDRSTTLAKMVDYFDNEPKRCNRIYDLTGMPAGLAMNLSRSQLKQPLKDAENMYNLIVGSILDNITTIRQFLETYMTSNAIVRQVDLLLLLNNTLATSYSTTYGVNEALVFNTTSISRQTSGKRLLDDGFSSYFLSSRSKEKDFAHATQVFWQQHCGTDGRRRWRVGVVFQRQLIQRYSKTNLNGAQPIMFVTFPLDVFDLNQCDDSDDDDVRGTHGCHKNLTACVHTPSDGMRTGSYQCCCRSSLDGAGVTSECFNGSLVEQSLRTNVPLPWKCSTIPDNIVDFTLKKVLLSINVLCAMVAFAMIFVAMTQRNMQDWGAKGLALMELFLFGAILLYCIVVLEFFEPSETTCCLITWCRELGFVLFYSPIVMKLQRNLLEHRVRHSHRSYIKEKDLLKYLGFVLAFTFTGLTAWTVTVVEGGRANSDLVPLRSELITLGTFEDKTGYYVCKIFKWHFAWHALELLLLLYACYLSIKARNTSWVDKRQYAIAVFIEMLVTVLMNSLRYYYLLTAGPNILYVLSFVQVQSTVTLIICMVLLSKFYYASVDQNNRAHSFVGSVPGKAHPSLARLRDNLVNGTLDLAEVPIGDMNPDDIKAELKRVYTQLRMYKLTNLYLDNPHIGKRKGGKKAMSKSTPRRVSVNNSVTKCAKDSVKKYEAEERSSLMKGSGDEESALPSDLTVQSSPHNAYLSRNSLAAAKKLQLESDLSVRI